MAPWLTCLDVYNSVVSTCTGAGQENAVFKPTRKFQEWFWRELQEWGAGSGNTDRVIRSALQQRLLPIGGNGPAMLMYLVGADGSVYDIDFSCLQPRPERYRMESTAREILRECSTDHPELLELLSPPDPGAQ